VQKRRQEKGQEEEEEKGQENGQEKGQEDEKGQEKDSHLISVEAKYHFSVLFLLQYNDTNRLNA
jgi:hypothetical protein